MIQDSELLFMFFYNCLLRPLHVKLHYLIQYQEIIQLKTSFSEDGELIINVYRGFYSLQSSFTYITIQSFLLQAAF